jgi:hypothetical protein
VQLDDASLSVAIHLVQIGESELGLNESYGAREGPE